MATALVGGHTESVLCVAGGTEGRLISGGEGGELCMWSLSGPVQQNKFTVPANEGQDGEETRDVTSICCSKLDPNLFFVSCGRHVLEYDCRKLVEPVHTLRFSSEEINQLSLNEKENYLAACDDTGEIRVISTSDRRLHKTLRRHANICASVTFRPNRASELVSGGYDNMLIQWDYTKGRTLSSIDMSELTNMDVDGDAVERYCVNPPFVHQVATTRDGAILAAGTDSALVHVWDARARQLRHSRTLRRHTDGVSQVCFLEHSEGASAAASAWLVSAGNDGKIVFWDTTLDSGDGAVENGHGSAGKKSAKKSVQTTKPPSDCFKAEIDHVDKINWITPCLNQGRTQIAVADSSTKISLYPLPL